MAIWMGVTLEDLAWMENVYSPPIGALNRPMAVAAQNGLASVRVMVTFSQWLRGGSERYLLESAQAEMAEQYLNRPGPPAEPGLGPLFWRRVFVPVYPRLPCACGAPSSRRSGSHRRSWRAREPSRRPPV